VNVVATPCEVAQLKAQVAELMKRIDQLEQKPKIKTAEVVTHANDLRVKISGMVNRAAWWASNGKNSNLQYVDNDCDPSRLNITAEKDLNCDTTVGGTFEVALLQNSTRTTDIKNASTEAHPFTARKSEVFAKSEKYGEIYLGRGEMASFNTMERTDLSATDVAMDGAVVNEVAEGVTFFDSTTQTKSMLTSGTTTAITVLDVFDAANGLYFKDRIRYNSPAIMGMSLQTSHAYHIDNDLWDVALKYGATFCETKLAAQFAYVQNNVVPIMRATNSRTSNTGYRQVNGSMGVLFPSGISFMVAAAYRDWKYRSAPDAYNWFLKLGYQHQYFEAGKTAFAIDYGHYNNFLIDTSTAASIRYKHLGRSVGAGVVQFLERIATELYMVARLFHLHVNGGDEYKDIKIFMTGARIKF